MIVEGFQGTYPVSDVGWGHGNSMRQSLSIDKMCRLIPETFFPASYPLCRAVSVVSVLRTLWASTIQKRVLALRPCRIRAWPT